MDTNDISTWIIIGCLASIVLCGLIVVMYVRIEAFREKRKKNYMIISTAIHRLEHTTGFADMYRIDEDTNNTKFIALYTVNLFTPISDDEYITDVVDDEIIHVYYTQERIKYGCS